MKKIGYRIESNRIIYFDWERRTYHVTSVGKYSNHREALISEGWGIFYH